jgi:predicted negative regulator of RcsB-dependent stress response
MIPAVIMTWFRTNPRNVWLIAGLVGVIAVLGFVYWKGQHDHAKKEAARDAVAVASAMKSDARAGTKAAELVAHDALVRVEKEKELADAVAEVPDGLPDAVAVAAACVELRQHGVSVADLPACKPVGR